MYYTQVFQSRTHTRTGRGRHGDGRRRPPGPRPSQDRPAAAAAGGRPALLCPHGVAKVRLLQQEGVGCWGEERRGEEGQQQQHRKGGGGRAEAAAAGYSQSHGGCECGWGKGGSDFGFDRAPGASDSAKRRRTAQHARHRQRGVSASDDDLSGSDTVVTGPRPRSPHFSQSIPRPHIPSPLPNRSIASRL